MNATGKSADRPTQEQIAQKAYQLWEQNGQPQGRELEHWLQAEAHLTGAKATSSQQTVRKPANTAVILGTKARAKLARAPGR